MAKAAKKSSPTSRKSSGRMASKGFFNPVDVHVGQRIRARRTLMGLSQTDLGASIGLTFQQVQKYERGSNRVSSSRLFDVARVLDVPLAYFFEEMTGDVKAKSPAQIMGKNLKATGIPKLDELSKRETLELVRYYYALSGATRLKLRELVKALAE